MSPLAVLNPYPPPPHCVCTVFAASLITALTRLCLCSLCVSWWRQRRWRASLRWSSPPIWEMGHPTWFRLEVWEVSSTTLWWSAGLVTGNSPTTTSNLGTSSVSHRSHNEYFKCYFMNVVFIRLISAFNAHQIVLIFHVAQSCLLIKQPSISTLFLLVLIAAKNRRTD